MTRLSFDSDTEATLLGQYVETLPLERSVTERDRLHRACHTFRALHPDESCLAVTHSTEWLHSWAHSVPNRSAQVAQVQALGRWWSWLFDRGVLDDNVLACFYPHARALQEATPTTLAHNLQRLIARYLEDRGPGQGSTRRKMRRRLESLNLFLHREVPGWQGDVLDESIILEWLRRTSDGRSHFLGLLAGSVSGFVDYLVELGRFAVNPFISLRARYGRRRIGDILAWKLGREAPSLTPVHSRPTFQSRLAPHLSSFVSLKRAMGLRYEATIPDLRRFDRFVADLPDSPEVVTAELVRLWIASGRDLSASTQRGRLGLVRQFSIYLARSRPDTFVPDRSLIPGRVPPFRAYIYSPDECRALLRAALALPARQSSLRPKTFYTVLLLLYATGLRVGEALRLRLRDLDVDAGTLLVRETKFLKSRVVPLSPTLAVALRAYLKDRMVAATGADAPLFINHARRRYAVDKFSEVFRTLLAAAGVPRTPRRRGPRVYDIRHYPERRIIPRGGSVSALPRAPVGYLGT